jgi:anti-anti-sigma factor
VYPDDNVTIEHENRDSTTSIIRLQGRLLLGAGCAELEKLVPQLVDDGRRTLVFDLSGVTHIDSTGMGRFIDAYGRLQKVGGSMRLAGAAGAVREAFHVTRLDRIFSFYPSVAAACDAA